jgi:hypothetical protein
MFNAERFIEETVGKIKTGVTGKTLIASQEGLIVPFAQH